jgi:hypothetical protein
LTLDEAISLRCVTAARSRTHLAIGKPETHLRDAHPPLAFDASVLASQQLVKQDSSLDNSSIKHHSWRRPILLHQHSDQTDGDLRRADSSALSQQYCIGLNILQAGLARDVESEKLRQAEQTQLIKSSRTTTVFANPEPSTVCLKPSGTTASWTV